MVMRRWLYRLVYTNSAILPSSADPAHVPPRALAMEMRSLPATRRGMLYAVFDALKDSVNRDPL
jgi:hypothetical protein